MAIINRESPPPRASRPPLHRWLTVLCYILPGVSSVGLVFLGAALGSTVSFTEQQMMMGLLLLLLLIAICSGVFASILKISDQDGSSGLHAKAIVFETTIFCLVQILVAPLVFISIAFGGCLIFVFT